MTMSKRPEPSLGAKKKLRALAIAHRANSSVDSKSVCGSLELFLLQEIGGSGRFVVVYDALEGEVDLSQIWEKKTQKQSDEKTANGDEAETICYAITRTPDIDMDLTVHPVTAELERHRWGYRQPVEGSPEIPIEDIAVVLVPGLAFDFDGGRLGWGAGYYDRFLARLNPAALKIGISDGYIVGEVPTDDHDVAMTHIVTPSGVVSV